MAEKKIDNAEVMTEEQLDQVAGGTRDEYKELHDLFPYTGWGYSTKSIQKWMKTCLNIDAKINGGYNFGLFKIQGSPNTYKRNEQSLTHQEVVEEAKAYLKTHPDSTPYNP